MDVHRLWMQFPVFIAMVVCNSTKNLTMSFAVKKIREKHIPQTETNITMRLVRILLICKAS